MNKSKLKKEKSLRIITELIMVLILQLMPRLGDLKKEKLPKMLLAALEKAKMVLKTKLPPIKFWELIMLLKQIMLLLIIITLVLLITAIMELLRLFTMVLIMFQLTTMQPITILIMLTITPLLDLLKHVKIAAQTKITEENSLMLLKTQQEKEDFSTEVKTESLLEFGTMVPRILLKMPKDIKKDWMALKTKELLQPGAT